MADLDLLKRRQDASAHSLGLSSTAIYDKFVSQLKHLGVKGEVLDYGAGQGSFTHILSETFINCNISAVDLMPAPQSLPEKVHWRQADLNEEYKEWENHFDFICSPEVIEHLENPRFVARQCYSWLKSGGYLAMSTPNNESWRSFVSLLFRGHFASFTDSSYPAHITALLESDLVRILKEAGFVDIRIDYVEEGMIPKIPSLTWQKASFGLLNGKRYSDNVMVIGRKA